MPIVVKIVSEKEYNEWLKVAKVKFEKYPENNIFADNNLKEKTIK
jgi:heme/copper-type cytochrome/quinol oxidase subunit 2